jgi:hypothetical protein
MMLQAGFTMQRRKSAPRTDIKQNIRALLYYPLSCRRNIDELLRVVDVTRSSFGSACGPVIVPVFKTGGRQAILSPVGSTPTRFRHFEAAQISFARHSLFCFDESRKRSWQGFWRRDSRAAIFSGIQRLTCADVDQRTRL